MSEIDFDGDPIWQAEIEHRNPDSGPIWYRVFNAEDEEAAKNKALSLFEANGYNIMLIDVIRIYELTFPERSENG